MRQRIVIAAMAAVCLTGTAAAAQMPSGTQIPGAGSVPGVSSLPTGALSKDALLTQAKNMVSDLTSMKSSGNLVPAQAKQVDDMLPKATSVKTKLEKPQVETSKLGKLASTLSALQKQMATLKGMAK